MASPIHIGFLARDFLKWGGGVWFIQNLLRGLASLSPAQVRITVFAPSDDTVRLRMRRVAGRLKRATLQPSRAWQHLFGSAASERALWVTGVEQLTAIVSELVVFDGTDKDLMRQCSALGIDVLLPVMTPPLRSSIPWVGYLYDCQHKYFPQFFTSGEIVRRDRAFADMLRRDSVVFANAKAVITDLQSFYPPVEAELVSLPFAPLVAEEELELVIRDSPIAHRSVVADAPYFIICNQFWVHKDHATAFRAFAKFVQDPARQHWRLLCTGMTKDLRAPDHFGELMFLIDELGIANRVIFTGYIARSLQQSLLYGARALLQPTLFEGGPGGGAAADAISLGIPCLLSDIPVNRELVDPLATFFRVNDPASLALAMEATAQRPISRPSANELLEKSRNHACQLGEALLSLAQKALAD